MKLKNWTAKRAGATISIRGVDVNTDRAEKIIGVAEVRPATNADKEQAVDSAISCVAVTMDGFVHTLT